MFETNFQNIAGNDGFVWFQGVVEDNVDPRQLGRVKVRVFGDHSPDKEDIKTEDLPWAVLMMPPTSASMNGIGESPTGLEQGSFVFGFYQDGANKQMPIIIGTWNGIPEESPDSQVGFHDPDEMFPMQQLLEEPDTNRLARGELDDIREQYTDCEGNKLPKSMVQKKGTEKDPYPFHYPMNQEDGTEHEILKHKRKKENLECEIKTAQPDIFWHQPITQYNAQYPYNKVWEFHYTSEDAKRWGHVLEFDSTPGYERIHLWHSSGTFMEIMNDPDNDDYGRKVEKIVGDSFEIDMKNKHLLVKGDFKVTVEGNRDEYIEGNWNMHIVGCINWMIDGDYVSMPREFEPFTECKGGKAEPKALEKGKGPAFHVNVTGGGTGTAATELGKGTTTIPAGFAQDPAIKFDVIGDYIIDVQGKTDENITISHTTTTPELYEDTRMIEEKASTTIENTAGTEINNTAGININLKANTLIKIESQKIENYACEQITLEATTILESTCLLLQNIEDYQQTIVPCSPCGTVPEQDEDGNYEGIE